MDVMFWICTLNSLFRVKKEYKWKENLKITMHSYKPWMIYNTMILGIVILVFNLYKINEIIGDKPVKYFGTTNILLGYFFFITIIPLIIWITIKITEIMNEKLDFEKKEEE